MTALAYGHPCEVLERRRDGMVLIHWEGLPASMVALVASSAVKEEA